MLLFGIYRAIITRIPKLYLKNILPFFESFVNKKKTIREDDLLFHTFSESTASAAVGTTGRRMVGGRTAGAGVFPFPTTYIGIEEQVPAGSKLQSPTPYIMGCGMAPDALQLAVHNANSHQRNHQTQTEANE